jgi:hypothetical protein
VGEGVLTNTVRAEARTGLGKSDRPGSSGGFEKRGQLGAWVRPGAKADGTAAGPARYQSSLT